MLAKRNLSCNYCYFIFVPFLSFSGRSPNLIDKVSILECTWLSWKVPNRQRRFKVFSNGRFNSFLLFFEMNSVQLNQNCGPLNWSIHEYRMFKQISGYWNVFCLSLAAMPNYQRVFVLRMIQFKQNGPIQ